MITYLVACTLWGFVVADVTGSHSVTGISAVIFGWLVLTIMQYGGY